MKETPYVIMHFCSS